MRTEGISKSCEWKLSHKRSEEKMSESHGRPRIVEMRERVLKQNDLLARDLRLRFRKAGVRVVSLVSSPGAGKTALLEKTLVILGREHRAAALVGDLATENDAARLR